MNIKFLSSSERKEVLRNLKHNFGFEASGMLFGSGKDKVRVFSGNLAKNEIDALAEIARIEVIGLYLARRENFGLRMGFDATQVFSSEISESVLNLSEEQFKKWMSGEVLHLKTEKGIYVLKFMDDFVGCGYCDGEKMYNYVPKDRRRRN